MILYIEEEYGYRDWLAKLTEEEYQQLIIRWNTMKNLNCLVPVPFIIPQATELKYEDRWNMKYDKKCHIHECHDSYLEGSNYEIPYDESTHNIFTIDGKEYNTYDLVDKCRKDNPSY